MLALEDQQIVGSSTGLPLMDMAPALQQPFLDQGRDPASVYYFADSVVLPQHRGQGLGVRFFIERESYAHKLAEFD
ncbi:GNAT family acetyltransferase, partial [Klebsiella pneumoniae]|nr:GNAT family acetyltransferase [Klebsiella pneumoniae]